MTYQPLETEKGIIPPFSFLPLIGDAKFPASHLIKPYLPKITTAGFFSWTCENNELKSSRVPIALDAPGIDDRNFKIKLKRGFQNTGIAEISGKTRSDKKIIGPKEFILRSEEFCDFSFTLDFKMSAELDKKENKRRFDFSIANALWIIGNCRKFYQRKFPVVGVCPGMDKESFLESAKKLSVADFPALAIRFDNNIAGGKRDPVEARKFWIELFCNLRSITDKPFFLLDASIKIAEVLLDERMIFAATGADGLFDHQNPANPECTSPIPFAISKIAELNRTPLPLSAYRLRSMI